MISPREIHRRLVAPLLFAQMMALQFGVYAAGAESLYQAPQLLPRRFIS